MARKWIVVVEDDARVRGVWIESLEHAGYAAVGSEDGLAAGELIGDLFPDLVVLDLHLPRMSGWDFLETVRAHPRWRQIPILIVSGFLDDDRQPIVEEGLNIVGRLPKPITFNELIERVQAVIGPAQPQRPAALD